MKALPSIASALALTLFTSCEKSEISFILETESESSNSAQSSGVKPGSLDPIPGTTPPGSRMDPTSNAYIVLDGSGSMRGNPISEAKRAVTSFIQSAPEDLNIGLFVFDNQNMEGREMVPLGKGEEHRKDLKSAINRVRAGGRTPLGAAIMHGTDALIQKFQLQLLYGDIRLIVVTDGVATDARVFENSIRHARTHHVPIYTIGFHMRNNHPLRQHSESYLTASDEQELLEAMQETLAELDDDAEL